MGIIERMQEREKGESERRERVEESRRDYEEGTERKCTEENRIYIKRERE